jgi:hypothetical protein
VIGQGGQDGAIAHALEGVLGRGVEQLAGLGGTLYPLEPYPLIREFAAMLKALKPGEQWMGREFFGYTGKGSTAFNFRRRSNGIVVAFSAEEWRALGELMAKPWLCRNCNWP